ncbi:MAG: ABC transporter substrate-binding protein [Chloroflexota bacterium]
MYEPEGEKRYECDLCKNWSLQDGGKTMVFSLRDDIKFHNGTTITSRDMKYTLEKLTGKVDKVVNTRMGFVKEYITAIEAPDDRTLILRLVRPAPVVTAALAVALAAILPDGTKRADLSAPPLGPGSKYTSGPFFVKEAVPDSHILYERNPDYFKKGLPYLDSIKIQVFTEVSAAATALLVGKVDLFAQLDSPPKQFWPQLYKDEKAGKMGSITRPQWCTPGNLFLNMNDPLIKDKNVRHAINLALDRVEYGDVRYGGDFVPATHFPAGTQWGRPENEIWDVMEGYGRGAKKKAEREQAKKLLADAGYPNGIDKFELMSSATDFAQGGGEVIQRGLKAGGINATMLANPPDATQRWGQGKYTVHNFRACLAIDDPDEVVAGYFLKGGARNLQFYENPEVDRLYPLMSAETDPIKRKQLFIQIENIVYDDLPIITGVDGNRNYWFNSKLRGFNPGFTLYGTGTNRGESWWLGK